MLGGADAIGHHGLQAVTIRELGHPQPLCPLDANLHSLGGPEVAQPDQGLRGRTLSRPPGHTHSEPDESSSTVPALMLMAMGMTPFSCSWRLCRSGGRGGGMPRLPSLTEEPREDPVPCSRGSRSRLLFSLTVGRHFFLRMPVAGRAGSMSNRQQQHGTAPDGSTSCREM